MEGLGEKELTGARLPGLTLHDRLPPEDSSLLPKEQVTEDSGGSRRKQRNCSIWPPPSIYLPWEAQPYPHAEFKLPGFRDQMHSLWFPRDVPQWLAWLPVWVPGQVQGLLHSKGSGSRGAIRLN